MRKNVMQDVTDTKESGSPQQHRPQQTQRTRPCQRIGWSRDKKPEDKGLDPIDDPLTEELSLESDPQRVKKSGPTVGEKSTPNCRQELVLHRADEGGHDLPLKRQHNQGANDLTNAD